MSDPIEAAARAWHDRQQALRRDDARLRPDGRPWQYEDLTVNAQRALRAIVEPIVNAVLKAVDAR